MNHSTSVKVKRGSQVHHTPQASRAHSEPVAKVSVEHNQPTSAAAKDQ
jgi:hypothetical protein